MENKYWYEVHITVELFPLGMDLFLKICNQLYVKAITINLEQKPNQIIQQDVMTSSKHYGSYDEVYAYAVAIGKTLKDFGFKILRVKIESEPLHEKSPKEIGDIMPDGLYFESHIAFLIQKSQRELLQDVAIRGGARISRNPLKTTDQGMVVMVTLRDYEAPFVVFSQKLQKLLQLTSSAQFIPYKKIEVEFAIYDSNYEHDIQWIR